MMYRKTRLNSRWKYGIWIFILWIVIHVTYISIQGLHDYKGNAGVAVILGNRVYADGTLSNWLQGRTDAALQLYKQKRVKKIYASGGISENDNGNYPEGTAMKQYLVKRGVRPEDVIADDSGKNTYCTAEDFLHWNEQQKFNSVIVVSQFYHITRTQYIFEKIGIKNVHHVASHAYDWSDIVGTLREVPAFYKYLIFY